MRAAFGFLTILGRGAPPTRRTARWFPLVGFVFGAFLGGVWWVGDRLLPPLLAAGLVVTADLAVTGMLHLDGLADSADGLLPPLPRERRLEVLADVGVGAFGVGAVVIVLLLRVSALAATPVSAPLLIGLWTASRSVLVVIMATVPYARPGGLADAFTGDRRSLVIGSIGIAGAAVLGAVGVGRAAPAAILGVLVAAAVTTRFARRRIGGFTGDVLGAIVMVGETVGLVVAAGRW